MFGNGPGPLLGIILVAAVVFPILMKKVANSIYQKTGVNTLTGVRRFLWLVQAAVLLMGIGMFTEGPLGLMLIVAAIVGGFVLHMLLSLKAGIGNAIIVGILQGVGGAALGIVLILNFVLKLFFRHSIFGGMFSIDESLTPVKNTDLEKADYAARQNGFENADAWAKNSGYSDASSAYDSGFFKDKI